MELLLLVSHSIWGRNNMSSHNACSLAHLCYFNGGDTK